MGPDEPLPDDVRRLLENESPAVMARELVRLRKNADIWAEANAALLDRAVKAEADAGAVRQATSRGEAIIRIAREAGVIPGSNVIRLADEVVVAIQALRKRADCTEKDLAEARATIEAVVKAVNPLRGSAPIDAEAWGADLADPARKDLLARLVAKELSEARTLATNRAEAVMVLATRAGIVFDPDEYTRGGRSIASLAGEAAGAIHRLRERADRADNAAEGFAVRQSTLQTTIDETNRVLDEAGVDREDDEGHVMPMWDRVADLVDERDSARARAGWNSLGATPAPFVMRREVGTVAVEVRAPTLADLEAAVAALSLLSP